MEVSPRTVFRRCRHRAVDRLDEIAELIGTTVAALLDGQGKPIVGISPARLDGWRWEPAADGPEMVVVPCGHFWKPSGWIEIDDLIATHPAVDRWWLLLGSGEIIETDAVAQSYINGVPLVLHPAPLDWVRAQCQGSVIIDWHLNPFTALRLGELPAGAVVTDDPEALADRCREVVAAALAAIAAPAAT